ETLAINYLGKLDGNLFLWTDPHGRGRHNVQVSVVPLPGSTGSFQNGPSAPPVSFGNAPPSSTSPPPTVSINPVTTVSLPSRVAVQGLDLSSLGLSNIGQGVLNLAQSALNKLQVGCLNLDSLGMQQLVFGLLNGSVNFTKMALTDLGVAPQNLCLGIVDLDKLAQGILCIGLLDPSKLDLSKITSGVLSLNGLDQATLNLGSS